MKKATYRISEKAVHDLEDIWDILLKHGLTNKQTDITSY